MKARKDRSPPASSSALPGLDAGPSRRAWVPVAGIGAATGAVGSLTALLRAIPQSEGLAFVLIAPAARRHDHPLAEVLSRVTPLAVVEADDGMAVESEHLYLMPRRRWLTIRDGVFRTVEPPPDQDHPIDHFFESLARDRGDRAAAVLLAGTGSDGRSGLRALEEAGGMALAELPDVEPSSAPHGALVSRRVELGLAPEDLASALLDFALQQRERPPRPLDPAEAEQEPLDRILELLAAGGFHQFLHHRKPPLRQRIARRARLRKATSIAEYALGLRDDALEIDALAFDLLLSSRLLRDDAAWKALRKRIMAPLIRGRRASESIRVWVPGCSSGEDAYSIALLLAEELEAQSKAVDVKIFASDIVEDALGRGRGGVFDDASLAHLSAERRAGFFVREGSAYRVHPRIREMIVFARHDLLRDPPFARLDLIVSRGLLARLKPSIRPRLTRLFHYALVEGGSLFLGRAEGVGRQQSDRLFEPVDRRWRIFRRLGDIRQDQEALPLLSHGRDWRARLSGQARPARWAQLLRHALLDRFGPPSALVDRQARILYFHGATEKFLGPPSGEPKTDLLSSLRPGLREEVSLALRRAAEKGQPITVPAERSTGEQGSRPVLVTVTPVPAGDEELLFVVSFEDRSALERRSDSGAADLSSIELEQELQLARDELHLTIERLEASNEDLRLLNDEVTAMNEELESANEELEFSRRQTQSLNEQLATLNRDLLGKVDELEGATGDLANLLNSADIATVFLDRDSRLRLFTPAIRGLMELRAGDIGRPITHFARSFTDDALADDVKKVLETLVAQEAVVPSDDARWFLRRIVPYRSERGSVDGVVVSFTDITLRRAAEDTLRRVNEQLEERVRRRTALVRLLQDVAVIANSAMPMVAAFEATLERVCSDKSWIAGQVYVNRLGTAEDSGARYVAAPQDPERVRALLGGRSFASGEGVVGCTIESGSACWSSDLALDSRFRGAEASELGVRSALAFPILVGERVVGALEFFSGATEEPGTRLIEVMHNIGTQLGRVIEREEARERMVDLAVEEQRSLGEELHDTLSQQIHGLTMLAQSLLQNPAATGGDDLRASMLVDGLQDAHRQVRVLSRGLVPVRVDPDGLEGALREMALEWEQLYGAVCVFEHQGAAVDADERVATALYRIAREAARNAVLHGGARRIVIRLGSGSDHIELEVIDDGYGMEEVPLEGPGMGLQIMRHRAEMAGGTLEIESARGRGTVVSCRIALDQTGGGGIE